MVRRRIRVVLVLGWVLAAASGARAEAVDYGTYAELLQAHVRDGVVDYAGFKADEARLDDYLARNGRVNPESLSREDRFAYYINAYNAWTIKLILTGYPGVKSIKDLGGLLQSPWKKPFVKIDGRTLTLDEIEHSILRPQFKDARVHFAIVCASKGCPPLIAQPYRGAVLDEQLNRVTTAFLNRPGNYRLEGDRFEVSSIFKWFGEDFGNLFDFYIRYAQGDLKQALQSGRDRIRIGYLDYDWSLNGT
jgi:Protein of unknown function, DUF547